jgi:hypothetical protein
MDSFSPSHKIIRPVFSRYLAFPHVISKQQSRSSGKLRVTSNWDLEML